jgi:hypothetical protein
MIVKSKSASIELVSVANQLTMLNESLIKDFWLTNGSKETTEEIIRDYKIILSMEGKSKWKEITM